MISHLDSVLQRLFMSEVAGLRAPGDDEVSEDQVGFQPPDVSWRMQVSGLGTRNALNAYLVDLRENRKLRSNERQRSFDNGMVIEEPAPARLDCHYLISAWSPATDEGDRTLIEHQLLSQVVAVLMNNRPLVPRAVFDPDSLPDGFPERLADAELPSSVVPVEGFPKLPEFWGSMGENNRWKPVVYLIVTLPVVLATEIAGPLVTTRITEYRRIGRPETAEEWIQIGGTVRDPEGRELADAWVRLERDGVPLQTTRTNEEGRFTFVRLRMGNYTLQVSVPGFAVVESPIGVPSPDGNYDVQLT